MNNCLVGILLTIYYVATICQAANVRDTVEILSKTANANMAIRCEVEVSRGDCRSCLNLPHCGYCADDDSCHVGKQAGPLRDVDCKSWHFSTCKAMPKCEEMLSCGECLAHPRCGWCATEDPKKISCMRIIIYFFFSPIFWNICFNNIY